MKKIYLLTIFQLIGLYSYSQMNLNGVNYTGNEWIDFNKEYYKITVNKDGIYKIKSTTLLAAGIDVNNIPSSKIQLWSGGKEQPIYVSNNTKLGPDDFILFYGEKHRLLLDSFLYDNWKTKLLNTEFSICSDETAYFLSFSNTNANGKRIKLITPNYNNISLTEEKYYLHTEKYFYNNVYYGPIYGENGLKVSNFSGVEGFSLGPTNLSNADLLTTDIVTDVNEQASVRIRVGLNLTANNTVYELNGEQFYSYYNPLSYRVIDSTFKFDLNKINSTNKLTIKNTASQFDRNLLSVAEITYPRKFNLEQYNFQTLKIKKGKKYFTFNHNGDGSYFIYSRTKNEIVKSGLNSDSKKCFLVDLINDENVVWFSENNGVSEITSMNKKKFNDLSKIGNNDILFLTSDKFLNLTNASNTLKDYTDYRNSLQGGSHKTTVVNVEEIYDQFGYGIDRHLHSFKNFNYYLNQIPNTIKYIYIVGKGREYRLWRDKIDGNDNSTLFVPSYGDFPSDEYLFCDAGKNVSKYAVGRISAIDAEELSIYLDKVKEYEAELNTVKEIDDLYWRKRMIHLAGGGNVQEQTSIKNFYSTMDATINSSTLGGETHLFSKTTTDLIGAILSQNILKLINSGVSIISFFGHSGVGSWDISIENPKRWENKGKYPIILSLGCLSGNIHTQNQGLAEEFVFTKEKGAIAFIASSGKAELFPQGVMGNSFYEILGSTKYGSTLGLMLKDMKEKHSNSGFISFNSIIQQMTLLGDPALKMYEAPSPDFTLYAASLRTNPEIISSSDKTFDLTLDIYNLGKKIDDSLNVRILFKNFTKNIVDTLNHKIKCPVTFDRVTFTIPNMGISSLGRNMIFVTLDPDNKIEEKPNPRAELNNELVFDNGIQGYEFYILDNTAIPVYPPEFGIVNILPELRMSTSNALAQEAKYILQIDTTALFNSPFLHNGQITSKGGTFGYKPEIDMMEGKVYYWRISPDSTNANGYTWINSSFIYLKEYEEGWNQSHYYQYKRNPLNLITINEDRKFEFSPRLRNTEIVNGKYVRDLIGLKIDFGKFAGSIRPWDFLDGGITIAIADPNSGLYRENISGDYGSLKTSVNGGRYCYGFYTQTRQQRKAIIDFVNNHIPDDYYVVFFTTYSTTAADLNADEWEADSLEFGENIFSALEKRGATEIRKLKKAKVLPYTYMYRQNHGYIDEDIGNGFNDIINSKTQFLYSGVSGLYESLPIGPAREWRKVLWNSDNEVRDTSRISIVGIKADNTTAVLIQDSDLKDIDISGINANEYPYIKLVYYASDYINRSVPYLSHWRVVAKSLPDGEINPKLSFELPDSVQQGETINFKIGLANYTKTDMDSILVKYTISNEANENKIVAERLLPLTSKKELIYTSKIDSRPLYGSYIFNFEINPDDDQPELYKFNNIGIKKFKILKDKINPVLDVYVDGIKIMDGDVITSNPVIKVILKDENKFLLLDNPENFIISLIYPDKKKRDFTINDPEVKFTKATDSNNNEASFELNLNLADGDYTLIANAKDATGNISGTNMYEVDFEVAGKQAITQIVNYPNPFSKSTRFVFNITGKVPEKILIQIMTLSGKVVKEITKEDLGPIKLGNNITEYSWDGTDEFGNKLANGVYLYKVIARDQNNGLLEKIGTELDSYFKSGIGKLVIIR